MIFRFVTLVSVVFLTVQCSDTTDTSFAEPVVQAYDTLELRYQQMGDLAMELISNVSTDPEVRSNKVPDLLDRQPVVSIDFRKPLTTRKDIVNFVNYQAKIDAGIRELFDQLQGMQRWQSAPLVQEYHARYRTLRDSINLAIDRFNTVVKEAKLNLTIPGKQPAR